MWVSPRPSPTEQHHHKANSIHVETPRVWAWDLHKGTPKQGWEGQEESAPFIYLFILAESETERLTQRSWK